MLYHLTLALPAPVLGNLAHLIMLEAETVAIQVRVDQEADCRHFGVALLGVDARTAPLLSSNGQAGIVLEVGGGVVAVYQSDSFGTTSPLADFGIQQWSRPIMIGGMGLVAVWQFMRSRQRATQSYQTMGGGGGAQNARLQALMSEQVQSLSRNRVAR